MRGRSGGYNPFKTYDRGDWNPGGGAGQTQAASAFDAERVPFIERIPPGLLDEPDSAQGPTTEATTGATTEADATTATMQGEVVQGAGAALGRSLAVPGGRYLLTTTADGVVVMDSNRALLRITYEGLLKKWKASEHAGASVGVGQRELFPEKIELSAADHFLLLQHAEELTVMGFDLRDMGGHTVVVYGLPVEMASGVTPSAAVEELLVQLQAEGSSLRDNHRERLAAALARSCCRWGADTKPLTPVEGDALVRRLLACEEPNYTPDGKPVLTIIGVAELEKRLKKR